MTACPEPVRLVAASAGEDVVALAHATGCPACRRAMREHLVLRDLAAELPAPAFDRARRDALTAELLARAEDVVVAPPMPAAAQVPARARRAVATIAIVTGALAAAAGALAVLEPHPPVVEAPVVAAPEPDPRPPPAVAHVTVPPAPTAPPSSTPPTAAARSEARPAAITASGHAEFVRRRDGGVDRVALRDGTLAIDAGPEGAPLVVTAGDIRVRAVHARLAAHAEDGVLRQVQVFAGSVEIQTDAGTVVISAGETWTYDDTAASTARVLAFRRGWDALRAGDFATAAAELERAEADPGVGEDATYWAAIAWGRAGELAKARAGLERFLDRFPHGARAGEAHLALARLLDATDPEAARRHREAALDDPDPRVAAAARAAL